MTTRLLTRSSQKPKSSRARRSSSATGGRSPRPPVGQRSALFLALFIVVSLLVAVGLVMVLSASSVTGLFDEGSSWFHFKRQLMWFGLGTVGLVVTMRTDYRVWRRFSMPLLFISLALLVVVLIPGVGTNVNGATRWIRLGPLSIQPSELAKLAMALFAADVLARREKRITDTRLSLRPILTVLGIMAVLILLQPNLGTTIVVGVLAFSVLFSAGVPVAPLAMWAGGAGAVAVWLSLNKSYRRDRVLAFLDPWDDPLNTGYQTIQSLVGIADGGLLGVGLGAGRAKWGYLPFAHTDFIFAVIAEELGFIGALGVISLFVLLGVFGVRTALSAPDRFGSLLAVGITSWLVAQAFINIGAVLGVLPITGVPLPFVSFGGSSLLVGMTAAGVLLNIARQAKV